MIKSNMYVEDLKVLNDDFIENVDIRELNINDVGIDEDYVLLNNMLTINKKYITYYELCNILNGPAIYKCDRNVDIDVNIITDINNIIVCDNYTIINGKFVYITKYFKYMFNKSTNFYIDNNGHLYFRNRGDIVGKINRCDIKDIDNSRILRMRGDYYYSSAVCDLGDCCHISNIEL